MKSSLQTVSSSVGNICLITLINSSGASVVLSNLGAGIVELNVPDAHGNIANVTLGYSDLNDYMHDGPCMGKTPGRYANRIGHGKFSLDGVDYELAVNCGVHHLHGGPEGFQNKLWDYEIMGDDTVKFTRTSAAGEEGYPGNLEAEVTYRWDDDNKLSIDYRARTDAPTPVSLTNHTYWNMNGEGSGTALNHKLQLACSHYLETDPTLCPTGREISVKGTPMDFLQEKAVNQDIAADFEPLKHGKGYDHCFCIDGFDGATLRDVATLKGESGRVLRVKSTLPGMQLYTANWLTGGTPKGRTGRDYQDYDAVALECQMYPDSPNRPEFPSAILRPGEEWHHIIEYQLSNAI